MPSPTVPSTVTFLPTATGQTVTLGPDTTAGIKDVAIDTTNLPAGALITISTQKLMVSGGSYVETDSSISISPAVAAPAAPGAGYQPITHTEPEMSPYGYQAIVTFVSGTLPTTGLVINLESV